MGCACSLYTKGSRRTSLTRWRPSEELTHVEIWRRGSGSREVKAPQWKQPGGWTEGEKEDREVNGEWRSHIVWDLEALTSTLDFARSEMRYRGKLSYQSVVWSEWCRNGVWRP